MAGFRPVAQTVELVLEGMRAGSEVVNTFYFKPDTGTLPITSADILALEEVFRDVVLPSFLACVQNQYRALSIHGQDLTTSGGAQADLALPSTAVGARGGNGAPGNVSVGMKRVTGARGRKVHGRIEIPGPSSNDIVLDTVTDTLRDLLVNLATQLLTELIVSGGPSWNPVHASRANGTSTPIVAWLFNTITDSQSTRLTGHGS